MKTKNLFEIRRKNLDRLDSYSRLHKGCVQINTHNSLEHEIQKLKVVYDLKQDNHTVVTEAELVREGFKVDVFDLDTSTVFEIDKTHKTNALKIDTLENSGLRVIRIDLKERNEPNKSN